ncbi:cytochrome P450 9e2-like [Hylaeus anthracinus]|uniref:cytochrome P450 9e2-like n=1 Tax=Hylaeus anthracinus TaxID=313031 RepID=UPI0023B98328|nr:cytochrome P450 9e2-like [Hylaeus anthracinus]
MDLCATTLTLVAAFLLVYHFLWKPMKYFERLGIPHEPWIPILGHIAPPLFRRIFMGDYLQRMYNRFSDAKYFGFYNFTTPVIVLRDPELLTSITVKNFDNFTDHRGFVDEELDPLMGKNLFALRGDRWREMRKTLSPSFTSSKMKIMFNLIVDCADNFTNHIAKESKGGKVYNLKKIFGRYATDVIATSSYGVAIDSMKHPNNEFYVFAENSINLSPVKSLKLMIGNNFPRLTKLFGIKIMSDEDRRYITGVVANAVTTRKEQGIYRPDMIQLMMEARNKDGTELTIDEMTNQAYVFFLAGYDTSSSFLCFTVHEIAANPDVQAKLRAEIQEVVRKTGGSLCYDAIKEMTYMDAVLKESGRLYPVVTRLDRVCVEEFTFPPATPNSKPFTMKPGGLVWFMPFAIQRDPKNFPDPLKFDPNRFLNDDVPQNINVPFGIGPRICIAKRFALMEAKIVLIYLLLRCEIEPCAQTTLPMRFDKKRFGLVADNGFWLNFKARDEAVI